MKINDQEVNIEDLVSDNYLHKEIKKGIFLSDYQISILQLYDINPYECASIEELIYKIDEILDYEEADDLESISKEISEFNYYTNTNK